MDEYHYSDNHSGLACSEDPYFIQRDRSQLVLPTTPTTTPTTRISQISPENQELQHEPTETTQTISQISPENQELQHEPTETTQTISQISPENQELQRQLTQTTQTTQTLSQISQEKQKLKNLVYELQRQLTQSHKKACSDDDDTQAILSNLAQYGRELTAPPQIPKLQDNCGGLIWEIPNILQVYRESLRDENQSLCSPVFYTSPDGYAMFLRMYLNGEGTGKNTHLSVFFSILQSENDGELDWPFNRTVQLKLVNHLNEADSITKILTPYPHSPTFQKPGYSFNIPSGFPKFAPVSKLLNDHFTKSNTITLQCTLPIRYVL